MSVQRRADTWEISDSEEEAEVDTYTRLKPDDAWNQTTTTTAAATTYSCKLTSSQTSALLGPPLELGSSTLSPTRRQRSREEVEADRERARQRREERETRRTARVQEKEERKQEQQRRKEAAENLKSLRPENCLKRLTVYIDPDLLQQQGSDILLDTLATNEWRISLESRGLPHSITWSRDAPQAGGAVDLLEEDQAAVLLSQRDLLDMVIAVKKTIDSEGGEDTDAKTFLHPVPEHLKRDVKTVVTLLVTDSHTGYRTGAHGLQLGLTNQDVEEVLVYLQLCKNISVVFLDDWEDVTDHVCAVTKALSKRPYKLLTDQSELPFCVDGGWASGVRVERDGRGLSQVWGRQIQQLNKVSLAVAAAVTAAYTSPRLLLQAYESLGSEVERKGLLADLKVKSEDKERRMGPGLSARVYRCFTAQNPQLVLD